MTPQDIIFNHVCPAVGEFAPDFDHAVPEHINCAAAWLLGCGASWGDSEESIELFLHPIMPRPFVRCYHMHLDHAQVWFFPSLHLAALCQPSWRQTRPNSCR